MSPAGSFGEHFENASRHVSAVSMSPIASASNLSDSHRTSSLIASKKRMLIGINNTSDGELVDGNGIARRVMEASYMARVGDTR
jgi:hypothetical protein